MRNSVSHRALSFGLAAAMRTAYVRGMGSRNPDRNYFRNLGWLADNGFELAVHCPGCDRRERVATIPLAKRLGYYADFETVAAKLKCGRCGRKGVEVQRIKWSEGVPQGWRPGSR